MSDVIWDVIVVGAGIVGSWTAYHLAGQSVSTLLLDQFPLPHTRGSSNGPTRLLRATHDKDEYIRLIPECYQMWKKLEYTSKTTLLKKTGMLTLELPPYEYMKTCSNTMNRHNMEHTLLDHKELADKYPMFKFSAEYRALYDPLGTVLYSNKCVQVLQDQFKKIGGTIQDGVPVTGLGEDHGIVTLSSSKGAFRAKKVVLCLGPWAKDLLSVTGVNLPLSTMPGRQAYFRVRDWNMYDSEKGVPMIYDEIKLANGYQFIIMKPMWEYPGYVKVATRGQPLIEEAHPNDRDKIKDTAVYDSIRQYIVEHLPWVDPKPCIVENCVYTMTPDRGYIVDRHPKIKNVYVGAGFSGHGFKSAPVTGKLLCQMVLEQPLSYDISKWSIDRFHKSKL